MKKLILFFFLFIATPLYAQDLNERLSGRILIQVEDNGEAWYVEPVSKERVYLGRPEDAMRIMREFGLGISEKDYQVLGAYGKKEMVGRILLRVEEKGEAYYVDPQDMKLHYLARPKDAFLLMRELGLGINNKDLSQINIKSSYDKMDRAIEYEVNLYFFHGLTCPHCIKAETFLAGLEKEYNNLKVIKFEVWNDPDNKDLFEKIKKGLGYDLRGVPLMIIGDKEVYGYSDDETSGEVIKSIVEYQTRFRTGDRVFSYLPQTYKIDRVIDGDTFDVINKNGENQRIRVIGIDTPELYDPNSGVECFGPEASQKAKLLLSDKRVRLERDETQGDLDKYGRLLRHVFFESGENFAEIMLREGYAREYTYSKASKYQKEYVLAESFAKESKMGLWQDEACKISLDKNDILKSSNGSGLEIKNIFYNGSEGHLEGDEYVEIINNGAMLDLSGFSLRDKSGKSYFFKDCILSSGESLRVYTGCGEDKKGFYYWCYTSSAIWNNTGDKAFLLDNKGEEVASYEYK